ncbi:MAG: hypothetical protein KC550_05800 [Nanoarchaeota archaeon]|nr:hypothetical protein [Nanoarchaeota archaeon]
MASAEWSIPLGILIFIVALIFAVYYYMKYKKIFLIVFTAAIATYVFAAFYTWDVFELNKNWIMAMLSISTILMFGLAKYFSKLILNPVKSHTSLKEKE